MVEDTSLASGMSVPGRPKNEDSSFSDNLPRDSSVHGRESVSGSGAPITTGRQTGDTKKSTLWVMTMHSAKGLEFDEVYLPFWTNENIRDEDRRLAFVSLTRARKRVLISYSANKYATSISEGNRASGQASSRGKLPGVRTSDANTRARTRQPASSSPFAQQSIIPQSPSILCQELYNYDLQQQQKQRGISGGSSNTKKLRKITEFQDLSVGQQLSTRRTHSMVIGHTHDGRAEYLAGVQKRALQMSPNAKYEKASSKKSKQVSTKSKKKK